MIICLVSDWRIVSITGDVEGCSENKDLPERDLPKQVSHQGQSCS